MKQVIRNNCFETNSSSVHSLTIGNVEIDNVYMMDDFGDLTESELKRWFGQYINVNFEYLRERIVNKKSIVIDVDWDL